MSSIDQLKEELADIEDKIKDAKGRLPAHSVKPPIMTELIGLEDRRDELVKQIEKLRNT